MIDGGFFIKRLGKLVGKPNCDTPKSAADWAKKLCKRHVQRLIGENFKVERSRWLDHVYRLFYYDAVPYDGIAHHPITNAQIQFGKTDNALFRNALFSERRRQRKFALRLGKVVKEDGWHVKNSEMTKKLLRTRDWLHLLEAGISRQAPETLDATKKDQLQKILDAWQSLTADDLRLGLRQKSVDMRIGIDITTLTLKKQVDTIILVTGDSDFVPAAKLARREGVEFILDPLWQSINDDLHEHVDGVACGIRRPGSTNSDEDELASETEI